MYRHSHELEGLDLFYLMLLGHISPTSLRDIGQGKGSLALAMLEGWRVHRLWRPEFIHKVFCYIVCNIRLCFRRKAGCVPHILLLWIMVLYLVNSGYPTCTIFCRLWCTFKGAWMGVNRIANWGPYLLLNNELEPYFLTISE